MCAVDDLIFFSTSPEYLKRGTSEFLREFEGSHEPIHCYLGTRANLCANKLVLSQSAYIKQAVEEFEFQEIGIREVPPQVAHKDNLEIEKTEYRKKIGNLQFIAMRAKPDISTALGI